MPDEIKKFKRGALKQLGKVGQPTPRKVVEGKRAVERTRRKLETKAHNARLDASLKDFRTPMSAAVAKQANAIIHGPNPPLYPPPPRP